MQVFSGNRRGIHHASLDYFNMTRKSRFMRHGKLLLRTGRVCLHRLAGGKSAAMQ